MRKRILRIDASARFKNSLSRKRADALLKFISSAKGDLRVTVRDVAEELPFINRNWMQLRSITSAMSEYDEDGVTRYSRELIEELKSNDCYIFSCPIYNFMIPASLKAWINLVVMPKCTFDIFDGTYAGLLKNKSAILVFSSNITKIGSEQDMASSYLSAMLRFMCPCPLKLFHLLFSNFDGKGDGYGEETVFG